MIKPKIILNTYVQSIKYHKFQNRRVTAPIQKEDFISILRKESEKYPNIFLHVGFGAVKRAFAVDKPYRFLVDTLTDHFESIIVPGFTPEFRYMGVYHKLFSRPSPLNGAFNVMFYENDYSSRTNDCIHNLLVKGTFNFDECNHHDSFAEEGCYGKLSRMNILCANIGTDHIRATQFHYVERICKVPYSYEVEHPGVIYYDENEHENITQVNYEFNTNVVRNWGKLDGYLVSEGVIRKYVIRGFVLRFFSLKDLEVALAKAIQKDPYFIVD